MWLDRCKAEQKIRGLSNKKMAEMTKTPESTFHRYWTGDGRDVPFWFVCAACDALEIPIDDPDERSEQEHEKIVRIYEERLQIKHERISELETQALDMRSELKENQSKINEIDTCKLKIETLENQNKELKETVNEQRFRMDHKNKLIIRLFVVIALLSAFSAYWIADSLNGGWGIIRYKDLLNRLPEIWQSQFYDEYDPSEDIVGLWKTRI